MREIVEEIVPPDRVIMAIVLTIEGDMYQAQSIQHGLFGRGFLLREHKNAWALAFDSLLIAIIAQQTKAQR